MITSTSRLPRSFRHGNFDYVNNSRLWDPNIRPDHTIPNSLYLSARPSWWGQLAWPPIGPDLNPMVGLIPAQARYQGIVGGTPTATPIPSPSPTPTATLTPAPTLTPTATLTPIPTPTPAATSDSHPYFYSYSYFNAYLHNQRRFRGHWHAWQLVSWRKRKLRLWRGSACGSSVITV